MENSTGKIEIDSTTAAEMDRRCVQISVGLARMKNALDRGDQERFVNLWEEVREKNWTNRKALLAAGVTNSILADRGLTELPPDDSDMIDTDALSLADLAKAMTGQDDESERE